MNERLHAMTDEELGRTLAAAVDWPPAPELGGTVSARIAEIERGTARLRPRLSLPSRRRTVLVLAAALLALAVAAGAAKLVIHLGAVTIRTAPAPPTNAPTIGARGPALGHPSTLDEAQKEAGFPALVPAALGAPDRVWVEVVPGGSRIALAWRAARGLPPIDGLPWGAVLFEFRGDAVLAIKTLYGEGNELRTTTVDGGRAYFITGPHELDLLTDDGSFVSYRVTGNVLVWQQEGVVLRLESGLSEGEAVAVAETSMRPGL